MLDKPYYPGISHKKQPHYQPVWDYAYWPVLKNFNNWNIIKLSKKGIPNEYFGEIHRIVLDGISNNMDYMVQTGKYSAFNKNDTKTIGYYSIKYVSYAFTLQEGLAIDG